MGALFRVLTAASAFAFLTGAAGAATIQVAQETSAGAGDFDANILGYISPFESALTAEEFYQYNNPAGSSYNGDQNGGPVAVDGLTIIYFLDGSDGLSLGVVHDAASDGSGGSITTSWSLLGDTADFLLRDDVSDAYTLSGGGTLFEASNAWVGCCTDGYALGSLDGSWSLTGEFLSGATGISDWLVAGSGGGFLDLDFVSGQRIRLSAVSDTPEPPPVPLPASFPLLLAGLSSIGIARALRRESKI
ncbi:hypothetical protein [Ovoidimarina sediminis]|uniref:hypothetical protein n=1 Tax=Ovoidimarina sediminis TaxID=3079856 RepID=UPI0029121BA5|nr:hypothetical protein [Rhodophyticola sp. MJ-SS7]MDU8942380.1 hypothetical protein [Rhodophyticola sp. MJ-SS7]